MEPSLNPPRDKELERITEYVDNISLKDLAYEIQSHGLDEKVKETILELEIPNASDFIDQTIKDWNLEFLLRIVSKKTMDEIRETIIDKIYWRDESWGC